jgi:hypothetical protein
MSAARDVVRGALWWGRGESRDRRGCSAPPIGRHIAESGHFVIADMGHSVVGKARRKDAVS